MILKRFGSSRTSSASGLNLWTFLWRWWVIWNEVYTVPLSLQGKMKEMNWTSKNCKHQTFYKKKYYQNSFNSVKLCHLQMKIYQIQWNRVTLEWFFIKFSEIESPWNAGLAAWTPFAPGGVDAIHWEWNFIDFWRRSKNLYRQAGLH